MSASSWWSDDVMPKVNGVAFYCPDCRCNVFKRSLIEPKIYKCNGCSARFEGEPKQSPAVATAKGGDPLT